MLATVLAAACGSNEIDYVDSPDASTGGAAGSSAGGSGGTSDSGGTAGSAGSAGSGGTSGTLGASGNGGSAGASGGGGSAGTAGTAGAGAMGGVGATGGSGGFAGGPTSCVAITVDPPQNAVACGTSVCNSADEIRIKCDAPSDCASGEDCCAIISGGKIAQTCRAKAECAGLGGLVVCTGPGFPCAKGSCQQSPYLGYSYCH